MPREKIPLRREQSIDNARDRVERSGALRVRNSAQDKVKQGKNSLAQRGQPPLTVSRARPDPAMYLNLCVPHLQRGSTQGRESALQVVTAAPTR